jgi:hypothetical protein
LLLFLILSPPFFRRNHLLDQSTKADSKWCFTAMLAEQMNFIHIGQQPMFSGGFNLEYPSESGILYHLKIFSGSMLACQTRHLPLMKLN